MLDRGVVQLGIVWRRGRERGAPGLKPMDEPVRIEGNAAAEDELPVEDDGEEDDGPDREQV